MYLLNFVNRQADKKPLEIHKSNMIRVIYKTLISFAGYMFTLIHLLIYDLKLFTLENTRISPVPN